MKVLSKVTKIELSESDIYEAVDYWLRHYKGYATSSTPQLYSDIEGIEDGRDYNLTMEVEVT